MTNNAITAHLNDIIGTKLKWARNEGEAHGLVARVDLAGGDYGDAKAAAKKLRAAGLEVETGLGTIDDDDAGALYLWVIAPTKDDVRSWDTAATYVATFPNGDEDGACDVEVQVGAAGGLWFIRTRDDAGGNDEADGVAYAIEEDAREAAQAYADDHNEACDGEDAEDYLAGEQAEREQAAT